MYDTYTVSRNVSSYSGNEEALVRRPVYCLLTQGQTVCGEENYSCVLITKGLQIIGHCNLLDETVYCMLFAFIAGAVTKDAETQTELTMNDMILFEQNRDGKAVR